MQIESVGLLAEGFKIFSFSVMHTNAKTPDAASLFNCQGLSFVKLTQFLPQKLPDPTHKQHRQRQYNVFSVVRDALLVVIWILIQTCVIHNYTAQRPLTGKPSLFNSISIVLTLNRLLKMNSTSSKKQIVDKRSHQKSKDPG